eukprot:TRINITY_DN8477_c0_g1_i1.p1 TRINITY_DN8477_c0_g1~~TRINITY_DN8477_c0_g1_i1.p1  ORF type:complete len:201 (-),score=33.57 TRINITY_DN8477_c0_g1_i1:26-628(-)
MQSGAELLVWTLDDPRTVKGVQVCGGKATQLANLRTIQDDVRVPPGIVLTAPCFTKFWKGNELKFKEFDVDFINEKVDLGSDSIISLYAQEMINSEELSILKGEIPTDLQKEILSQLNKIFPSGRSEQIVVAVRSSAIGEDSEDASFAGIHETYLNIPLITNGNPDFQINDQSKLWDAIRCCWASSRSNRAAQYLSLIHI